MGFPFRFVVYDDIAENSRRRVIKIEDCGHFDQSEAEIEIMSNGCKVVVPATPAADRTFFHKDFHFEESGFNFEFKEDQMQLEGTVMTLLFDVNPAVKRIARFPAHASNIKVPQLP